MNQTHQTVKVGTIVTTYASKLTARVEYADLNNKVSAELPIIVSSSANAKFYSMPRVGDQVLCLFVSKSQGFILGSFYDEQNPPPERDDKIQCVQFDDGSLIKYDHTNKKLTLNMAGDIEITTLGSCIINGHLL